MDIYTACEEAYKRGYERAKAEAEEEIKSKNAEIEKLTINMNAFGLTAIREKERADTARAEAIKEFLERAKEKVETEIYDECDPSGKTFRFEYKTIDIDDLYQIAKEIGVEL